MLLRFYDVRRQIFRSSTIVCMSKFDSFYIIRQVGLLRPRSFLFSLQSKLLVCLSFILNFFNLQKPLEFSSLSCWEPLDHFYQSFPTLFQVFPQVISNYPNPNQLISKGCFSWSFSLILFLSFFCFLRLSFEFHFSFAGLAFNYRWQYGCFSTFHFLKIVELITAIQFKIFSLAKYLTFLADVFERHVYLLSIQINY